MAMSRLASILFASALLSACAGISPVSSRLQLIEPPTFDAVQPAEAASTATPSPGACAEPSVQAAAAVSVDSSFRRRGFTPPSGRQPELQLIAATAIDRMRVHRGRRVFRTRKRRHA
jgi:hypothetical protein